MSKASSSSLGQPGTTLERAQTTLDMDVDEAHKEAWAAALTTMVQAQVRVPRTASEQSPAGGDGALTQTREGVDARSQTTGVSDVTLNSEQESKNDVTRIVGELDGGRLGKVKFTVIRENGQIGVVLGIEDAKQRMLAGLEKNALLQSLQRSGLKVALVSVTTPEAAGTAFALSRRTTPHHGDNPIKAYRGQRSRPSQETESELDLIG